MSILTIINSQIAQSTPDGQTYNKTLNNFYCTNSHPFPSEYGIECSGQEIFKISTISGVPNGLIKMVSNGDNAGLTLGLTLNTVFDITADITGEGHTVRIGNAPLYLDSTDNASGTYIFKYSSDGGITFGADFTLNITAYAQYSP